MQGKWCYRWEKGTSLQSLRILASPHHDDGLAGKPGEAFNLYLHISWRLSVHVIDDGEVPVEEGVRTGWA